MPEVASAAIKRIYYSTRRHELFVAFTSGRVYVYFDVPPVAYDAFRDAPSLGRHFNLHVRDHYRFQELTPSH